MTSKAVSSRVSCNRSLDDDVDASAKPSISSSSSISPIGSVNCMQRISKCYLFCLVLLSFGTVDAAEIKFFNNRSDIAFDNWQDAGDEYCKKIGVNMPNPRLDLERYEIGQNLSPWSNLHGYIPCLTGEFLSDGREKSINTGRFVYFECTGYPRARDDYIQTGICANRNAGKPSCPIGDGNPVHTATGNKFQQESDYHDNVHGLLSFERYYSGERGILHDVYHQGEAEVLGRHWAHSFDHRSCWRIISSQGPNRSICSAQRASRTVIG